MNIFRSLKLITITLAFSVAVGCTTAPPDSPLPVSPLNLKPYPSATHNIFPTPTINATALPLPSPTPSVYLVVSGDSLGTIAEKFGMRLADLQAANPGVVSETMTIGQKINIPVTASGDALSTPAHADLSAVRCYPAGAETYCLVAVHNSTSNTLENVKVQMSLLDAKGNVTESQEAFLPLNILPPGGTLPAYTLFTDLPAGTLPVAQLAASIKLLPNDVRYLPAITRNVLVSIDWDGRSARAEGHIFLPRSAGKDAQSAATLWLAGIAYDANGQIVGFRRWEWQGSLKPGNSQGFDFSVYSFGPAIETVDVIVEARP